MNMLDVQLLLPFPLLTDTVLKALVNMDNTLLKTCLQLGVRVIKLTCLWEQVYGLPWAIKRACFLT